MVTKETVIEGINPPSPNVAFSGATITTAQIPVRKKNSKNLDKILNEMKFSGPNTSDWTNSDVNW